MTVPKSNKPAFLIAGTHSGCGKTTVTLGILSALRRRGLAVQPFKSGPDFIDPTLHRLATGKVSRNLDLWMCGPEFTAQTFTQQAHAADVIVVEGVMGLFDGGEGGSGSLAKHLGLPAVLVVDARSAAESVAAVVKGFETFDSGVSIIGTIINRIGSPRHLELVGKSIRQHCRAAILGHLPRQIDFTIPERHLGLHMGEESPISPKTLENLADVIEQHIDLDRILELTSKSPDNAVSSESTPATADPMADSVRIGVARDRAFCFYYEDNLDLLRQAGAETVFFSPLSDGKLPDDIDGIYLGGGYPELFARQLADNHHMLREIRNWSSAGRPIYAECGGFMYLTQGVEDTQGKFFPMAGVYPVRSRMNRKRAALGYRQATLADNCILGAEKTVIRGHEFHYSHIDTMPESVRRIYLLDGEREGYLINNTLGGYLHLHFGYHRPTAANFIDFCRNRRENCRSLPEVHSS